VRAQPEHLVPATQESQARTCAFSRVNGPWLITVPGIIVLRASGMGALAFEFLKSTLFVWFAGALLLFWSAAVESRCALWLRQRTFRHDSPMAVSRRLC